MNRILRMVGLLIGTIGLLWFMIPFAVAGIINIGNATGIVLCILFVIYMGFMPVIHEWIVRMWNEPKKSWFVKLIALLVVGCVATATVETGCMISACMKTPAENATAVVLGCRVYGERPSLSLIERLEAAYEYLEENPNAVCVVSGGQGSGENISEAECMYRWLTQRGIDESRIYKEEKSTSTDENIAFTKELILEQGLNENITIITSEYHTYRAGKIAEKYGLSYGSAPGKTAIWLFPTFYMRELYAILAEWVF